MKNYAILAGLILLCLHSCGEPSQGPSQAKPGATMKLAMFNDVDGLRAALSENGIGGLRPCRIFGFPDRL